MNRPCSAVDEFQFSTTNNKRRIVCQQLVPTFTPPTRDHSSAQLDFITAVAADRVCNVTPPLKSLELSDSTSPPPSSVTSVDYDAHLVLGF